jgi:hypothetical protein
VGEAKEMLTSGDFSGVVSSLKGINDASREVEKISQNSLEKVQAVLPLVQVIKNQDITNGGSLNINSVQIASSSISLILASTTVSASSSSATSTASSTTTTIKNNLIKPSSTTPLVVPLVTPTTLIIKK